MRIEQAMPSDLPGIRWLLEYEHLPSDDVTDRLIEHFLVCHDARGVVVGAIALEPCGDHMLLRSLVVAAEFRKEGLGSRLTLAAEALATRMRAGSIYLLTTTAERFFAARGYRVIARADAPPEVQRSSQFSVLCPSTAVLMVKP